MDYQQVIGGIGFGIDAAGVVVITLGALVASVRFVIRRQGVAERSFTLYRQDLGRSILLGLEFLIAGDIIRTVVLAPTMGNVLE